MIVARALAFVTIAHRDQVRKYTGEPYAQHPIRVAGMIRDAGFDERAQVVALLHDVLEDCDVSPQTIAINFGADVLRQVQTLTDVDRSRGNRATRKKIDADRLAAGDGVVHSIKCADTIDNAPSIVEHDPSFAPLFLAEKRALVPRLVLAHPDLLSRALALIGAKP